MTTGKRIVFLDLEETLIDAWGEFNILYRNTTKIKYLLKTIIPHEVSIFSYAIWFDDEVLKFAEIGLQEQLEILLECKFSDIPTIYEIKKDIEEIEGFKYDSLIEFIQLNGKVYAFIKYCLTKKNSEFWLVDDVVPNMVIENKDRNVKINFINVNTGM